MRLLASVQHYLATTAGDTLSVQQYAGARSSGAGLDVEIDTGYPWSGLVTSACSARRRKRGAWHSASRPGLPPPPSSPSTIRQNGRWLRPRLPAHAPLWQAGDEVRLRLDMTPRWTSPDRRVDAVRGCAAIERGPLVYCFEQADQAVRLDELAVGAGTPLAERAVTADGVGATIQVRRGRGPAPGPGPPRRARHRDPVLPVGQPGRGMMRVWIPRL